MRCESGGREQGGRVLREVTTRDATLKRFKYKNHDQLRVHLADFMAAYRFVRRLKTLGASRLTTTSAKTGRQSRINLLTTSTQGMSEKPATFGQICPSLSAFETMSLAQFLRALTWHEQLWACLIGDAPAQRYATSPPLSDVATRSEASSAPSR